MRMKHVSLSSAQTLGIAHVPLLASRRKIRNLWNQGGGLSLHYANSGQEVRDQSTAYSSCSVLGMIEITPLRSI